MAAPRPILQRHQVENKEIEAQIPSMGRTDPVQAQLRTTWAADFDIAGIGKTSDEFNMAVQVASDNRRNVTPHIRYYPQPMDKSAYSIRTGEPLWRPPFDRNNRRSGTGPGRMSANQPSMYVRSSLNGLTDDEIARGSFAGIAASDFSLEHYTKENDERANLAVPRQDFGTATVANNTNETFHAGDRIAFVPPPRGIVQSVYGDPKIVPLVTVAGINPDKFTLVPTKVQPIDLLTIVTSFLDVNFFPYLDFNAGVASLFNTKRQDRKAKAKSGDEEDNKFPAGGSGGGGGDGMLSTDDDESKLKIDTPKLPLEDVLKIQEISETVLPMRSRTPEVKALLSIIAGLTIVYRLLYSLSADPTRSQVRDPRYIRSWAIFETCSALSIMGLHSLRMAQSSTGSIAVDILHQVDAAVEALTPELVVAAIAAQTKDRARFHARAAINQMHLMLVLGVSANANLLSSAHGLVLNDCPARGQLDIILYRGSS